MPRVIVNSTPLIVLSNIGKLDLLRKLYKEIYIPQAVFDEVTEKQDSACQEIKNHTDWIHVCAIKDFSAKRMYQAKLHDGEVEVMILAQESPKADLVILDDNAAKKTAKYLGLTVTGTLGILLKSKKNGFIDNITELLDKMLDNGFFVSPEIQKLVKTSAGE